MLLVVVEVNSLFLEGDSQPALHLVHLMLGVHGGHTEISGDLGFEELREWEVLLFWPVPGW